MPRKTSDAERRLAELDRAVDDARGRLAGVHHEQRMIAAAHDQAEAQIRNTLYDSAKAGSRPDVSVDRDAASKLVQQLADTGPVEAALSDGVQAAERARDRYIVEHFPALEEALTQRAHAIVVAGDELAERHAREASVQRAAERELEQEWRRLARALPSPLRGRFDPETLTLDPSPLDPDPAIAIYVAEPGWPDWARAVIQKSQNLAEEIRHRSAAGIPMAG